MSVTLSITDQELATTALTYLGEAADLTYKKTALLNALREHHGEGKPAEDGGDVILKPVVVGEHSTITQHTTGFEPINMAVSDVAVSAQYYWGYWNMPIAVSGFQSKKNNGGKKILDEVKTISKAVLSAFMRYFNRQLLKGDVAALSRLHTLNGVDYATGFLEEGAPGSGQTNSVGTLSKTTYASISGWNNQVSDVGGSFNSKGQTGLDSLQIDCQSVSTGALSIGIASKACMKNIKRSLRANERYINEKTLDGGRMRIEWDGAPIEFSPDMPNDGTVTGVAANNDEVSLYFLDLDSYYVLWHNEGYFEMSDFMTQSGYDVKAAFVTVMAQAIAESLGGQGIMIGGDTF